ncbi:simple sugar transport system permease protein [Cetobacterium ceti]|uniref:Simple sugar transport system permease protein n=1 Tax=Cetobacterium ceti TaxID=180163 RepID=A0A1T4MGJ5_9FUSO|nr:ABC transporter [Cetobacterium ceti]SJZ65981.1 simple sugar transport system permease protein [Cetobacterium ceti]
MNKLKKTVEKIGVPRFIIGIFLLSLYIMAPFAKVDILTSLNDTFIRVGMNIILVLSLIPMVQSGTGLNFGMPLGIEAGLLGALISLELGLSGILGFLGAILIAIPISIIFGYLYGKLLNKVKGGEMMIATYVGFSSVAIMCIMWLILPFKKPDMIWAYGGEGLRTTISIDKYWGKILSEIFYLPKNLNFIGELLFFLFIAWILREFFKSKNGIAMKITGSNEKFAKATGININSSRINSVILSTILSSIGIIVYQQSFGFVQLYLAPFYMAFPAIAALLIGGASLNKASISNVILGTFLFQGIITMTPVVISGLIKTDMSETLRVIISNGMILYALTRRGVK